MSLLWHIASLGRWFERVPQTPPVAITVEDVTPPFEARIDESTVNPIPESEPNECGLSSCNKRVTWPRYWCSEDHHKWWLMDLYKPPPTVMVHRPVGPEEAA